MTGTIGTYEKLPVRVKAAKLGRDLSMFEAKAWINSQRGRGEPPIATTVHDPGNRDFALEINTLEGKMLARLGDYVIRGVKGEFYPCKSDIFEATYREVFEATYREVKGT